MQAVVASSMFIPKEKHNQLLEKLLSELEGKRGQSKGIKVVLAGSICDDPGEGVLETVEETGMVVVDDDFITGSRYFSTDVSSNGQPVETLARYHWEKVPCPASLQTEKSTYAPYLIEMVKRSEAQAVIEFNWKFCSYQMYERPYLAESFAQAGMPHLRIELAEELMDLEALRTRLEAFVEIIKGGK